MTIDVAEYTQLKDKVDRLRTKADKAKGAFDASIKRIKDEFGCDSLEEARERLDELKTKQAEADCQYVEAMDGFKEKWGEVLG